MIELHIALSPDQVNVAFGLLLFAGGVAISIYVLYRLIK